MYHKIKRHFKRQFAFQDVQLKINLFLNSLERKTEIKDLALAENKGNIFARFDGEGFLWHLVLDPGKPSWNWWRTEGCVIFTNKADERESVCVRNFCRVLANPFHPKSTTESSFCSPFLCFM